MKTRQQRQNLNGGRGIAIWRTTNASQKPAAYRVHGAPLRQHRLGGYMLRIWKRRRNPVAEGASLPGINACTRVTLVDQGNRAGLATGSICNAERGSGFALMVLQYTYTACTGPGSYLSRRPAASAFLTRATSLGRKTRPSQQLQRSIRRPTDGEHRPNGRFHLILL